MMKFACLLSAAALFAAAGAALASDCQSPIPAMLGASGSQTVRISNPEEYVAVVGLDGAVVRLVFPPDQTAAIRAWKEDPAAVCPDGRVVFLNTENTGGLVEINPQGPGILWIHLTQIRTAPFDLRVERGEVPPAVEEVRQ